MKSRIIVVILLPCAIVGGVYFFSAVSAQGGRGFFSPDTFQVKTQSEILLPATEIPLYRSSFEYRDEPYDLVAFLVAEGYWVPIETDEPRWLLMFHWNNQWRDGQTQLYRYMSWYPDEWIEWTKANPPLARVLWPKVLSILRRNVTGGYAEHVMFLARQSTSVDQLRAFVNNDPELKAKGISMR